MRSRSCAARRREGLSARLAAHGLAPGRTEEDYEKRLAFELDVIVNMTFAGYFLIVADFIQWAKAQGIPVGPGRGSGAGSLVAWALTITDLDPLRFGLLFERFLNPERVSMPDFDIDFCQERRDEVIAYVRERYGADRVAQIITFGSFLARGVLRNVGRVLEMPLGQVDKLAKLVPQNPAHPVTPETGGCGRGATAGGGEGRREGREDAGDRRAARGPLFERLDPCGGRRHRRPAADRARAALPRPEILDAGDPVQHEMGRAGRAGEVRLPRPEDPDRAEAGDRPHRPAAASRSISTRSRLDDAKTYEALGRGETVGVFQVESGGMRRALVEMRADRFEDLIALVALYRPGPMANIPTYCARKLGHEKPDYIHPMIEPILRETYGVIVYQEQVMQIAQALSGYSLGEADILRRAMGKKIKKEMDAQRARFVDGAVERGLTRAKADEIFDLLAKFADYGFNKSHAAAYALITYWTAWFKANHPAEFLAASMTLDKGNTDKLAEFRAEAIRLGIKVVAPSVNDSLIDFDVRVSGDGGPAIHYALSAIKGVGEAQAEALVLARGTRAFASLGEMAARLDPRAVNKKALESLAAAGAFDCLEPDRATAFAAIEPMLAIASRGATEKAAGQNALFGETEAATVKTRAAPWPESERLRREFDAVGFFLSGHPLEVYDSALKRLRATRWADFARAVRAGASTARLGASVLDRYERRTRNGGKIGVVQLSDPSGSYEAILFQEGLSQFRDLLEKGADVLVTLQAAVEGEDVRARIVNVERLTDAAAKVQKGLRVFLRDETPLEFDRAALERPRRRRGVPGCDPRAEGRRDRNPPARPLCGQRRGRRRAQGRARRGGGRASVRRGEALAQARPLRY